MTMRRKRLLLVVLLMAAITQFPLTAGAQGAFPRSDNESLALRLYNRYVASRARLAQLETDRTKVRGFITEVAPSSTMVGTAVAEEDVVALREVEKNIANEQKFCRQLEAFWEKNRAIPPAPALSFAGRYGPLSTSGQRSTDPTLDKIEYAIRHFPFNAAPSPDRAVSKASPNGVWTNTVHEHRGCMKAEGVCKRYDNVRVDFSTAPDGTIRRRAAESR